MGLSTLDGSRAKAAFWKASTIVPLAIFPRLPPTDGNNRLPALCKTIQTHLWLCPPNILVQPCWTTDPPICKSMSISEMEQVRQGRTRIFSNAPVAFECFSHRICRTVTALGVLLFPFQNDRLALPRCWATTTHLCLLLLSIVSIRISLLVLAFSFHSFKFQMGKIKAMFVCGCLFVLQNSRNFRQRWIILEASRSPGLSISCIGHFHIFHP